ncbi:MAG: OmpA family protein [Clostridiales Family XIII bacterium]|jgi:outer membrane protein OmpA-like peptidoglycan-associated protein|nr:OmpA family protein [Clostridiales Family XIII bacterium]
MNMKKMWVFVAVFVLAAALFAGCDKKEDGGSAGVPLGDGGASARAEGDGAAGGDAFGSLDAQADPVTVTRTALGMEVKLTAHPIQSDGTQAALVVDYELTSDLPEGVRSLALYHFLSVDEVTEYGPASIRLFDLPSQTAWIELPQESNQYQDAGAFRVMPDKDGKPGYTASSVLSPDRPFASSVTLYAAPEGLDTVDVFLPVFGVIPDVPIVNADGGLGPFTELTGAPAAGSEAACTVTLRRFLADYEGEMFVVDEGEEATLTITSDVLFATDEYELTAEAQEVIARAVEQIKAEYDSGTVKVVGHTDDVADDAYNQTLSEKRAESVRAELAPLLGSGYTLTAEGRGETEPLAEGTSAEARAVNRRVDIVMSGVKHEDKAEAFQAGDLLPADYPTGQGGADWLEYRQAGEDTNVGTTVFKVRVENLVRTENGLVGYLRIGLAEDGTLPGLTKALYMVYADRATSRDLAARGYVLMQNMIGTFPVALLTAEGRLYGYDYVATDAGTGENYVNMVCNSGTGFGPTYGDLHEGVLVPMIWPDPGTDTVTIDVDGVFRIENVPVSDDASLLAAAY